MRMIPIKVKRSHSSIKLNLFHQKSAHFTYYGKLEVIDKEQDEFSVLPIEPPSGDRGIRTPDLRDANAALSQLSYIPVATRQL
jgi:hypothetical protein